VALQRLHLLTSAFREACPSTWYGPPTERKHPARLPRNTRHVPDATSSDHTILDSQIAPQISLWFYGSGGRHMLGRERPESVIAQTLSLAPERSKCTVVPYGTPYGHVVCYRRRDHRSTAPCRGFGSIQPVGWEPEPRRSCVDGRSITSPGCLFFLPPHDMSRDADQPTYPGDCTGVALRRSRGRYSALHQAKEFRAPRQSRARELTRSRPRRQTS
jgi:hypothetical protein